MSKIIEKLLNIQQKLNAPKNNFNSFGKYSYRSCEDILEAVKPLLNENKCALILSDSVLQVGERYYIKADAILKDCESDESISNSALAREADEKKGMDDSQITGTASSYARKYALNGLFCIDDTKDADTMDNSSGGSRQKAAAKPAEKKPRPQMPVSGISPEQAKELYNDCTAQGVNITLLCELYKVGSISALTVSQHDNIRQNWTKVKERCVVNE